MTRLLPALALALALAATPAHADDLLPQQWHTVLAIHDAAVRWGASEYELDVIGWCESTMNMNVYNPVSGTVGPFQFTWDTWQENAPAIDRMKGPFNSWAAADVAARLIARGESWRWTCAR